MREKQEITKDSSASLVAKTLGTTLQSGQCKGDGLLPKCLRDCLRSFNSIVPSERQDPSLGESES